MTRYIIIGDIHGCFDELLELTAKTNWVPGEDRLILAGDLVDRGPKSAEVVQWARENNVEIVRGNHDDRYVQYYTILKENKPVSRKWQKRPERIDVYNQLSVEDLEFLARAPTLIKLPEVNTLVVHAGFMPGWSLDDQPDSTKMHIRFLYDNGNCYSKAPLDALNGYIQPMSSFFRAEKYEGPWDVVYGHHVWSKQDIKIHQSPGGAICYGIDTGCCFNGKLTALVLTKNEPFQVVQVDSKMKSK